MSSAPPPQPPQIPAQVPFKSVQHEFTEEHNKTFGGLAISMRAFANLMKILGAVFGALVIGAVINALLKQPPAEKGGVSIGPWGMVVVFAPFTLLFLTFGFWAGGAAASFRKIAETRNEDVWNLMNALASLKNMFALLRFLVIAALVLLVIGVLLHWIFGGG